MKINLYLYFTIYIFPFNSIAIARVKVTDSIQTNSENAIYFCSFAEDCIPKPYL